MSNRPRTVYQIDFTAVASGKLIASSKRRVRWRFGFANMSALDNGEVGTACRGEEHDVTLVWSITSGKRLIMSDGQEIHFSTSRNGIFDYSWTMRNNHILKIVAHATPPLSPTPGFRQYDFFVDGQSFFTFPKVYRLGMAPNDPRGQHPPQHAIDAPPRTKTQSRRRNPDEVTQWEAPTNPDEEEAYLQEAIRQSLNDDKPKATAPAPSGDLLDFDAPVAAAPAPHAASSDPFGGDVGWGSGPAAASANPFAPAALPPSTNTAADPWGAPAPSANPYAIVSAPSSNPYAITSASNPYAAAPTPSPNPYAAAPNPYATTAPAPSSNPYAAAPTSSSDPFSAGAPPSNPYQKQQPQSSSSQGNPYAAPADTNGYAFGAPPSSTDPFSTQAPSSNPYQQQQQPSSDQGNPYAASAPADTNGYAYGRQQQQGYGGYSAPSSSAPVPANDPNQQFAQPPQQPNSGQPSYSNSAPGGQYSSQAQAPSSWAAPPPISTSANYDGQDVPLSVTPQAQPTPSTLGFGSPPPNFAGYNPHKTEAPAPAPEPAAFTMNTLSGQGGLIDPYGNNNNNNSKSLADQAYAKLANLDTFSLVSSKDETPANPFASSGSINDQRSLADIQKTKPAPSKEVMRTQPSNSLVVSSNQNSYGSQYGIQPNSYSQQPLYGQQPLQQQPPSSMYGQQPQYGQPPQYGQQQQPQQPAYGRQQQPMYGQPQNQPPHGQPPGMAQFGQPPPAPSQYGQPQYGQPPAQQYGQQQQGMYGQPF